MNDANSRIWQWLTVGAVAMLAVAVLLLAYTVAMLTGGA